MKQLLLIFAIFAVFNTAQAETRYIVDQAKLPMRSGQSTKYAIVRMLPSGAPVQVLEQSPGGYSRVRAPGGKEGWILSRYLMKEPAARSRLLQAEKELSKLQEIKQKKASLEQERSTLKRENSQLKGELKHIRTTAANAVAVADENRTLKSKMEETEQELESLRQETSDIRNGAQQRWFMLGGGAILLGILLGLILPRLKVRKKDRWGSY